MASMVPYAARGAAPVFLTPEMAQSLYNDSKWLARQGLKSFKKRKRNTPKKKSTSVKNPASRVGSDVGSSNSKRVHTFSAGPTSFSDDTLLQHELILPQEGTTPAQRQRNLINLRGFKLCMEFQTSNVVATAPSAYEYYVNIALLIDKRDPQNSTLSGTRFFRDSNGTDRGIDFAAVPDSLGKNCLPINSDQFLVFWRTKFKLASLHPSGDDKSWNHTIDQYIPINRQIRFTETNTPDTRFHVVYWINQVGTTGVTPVVRGTVAYRHITYFRETCDC